MAELEPTAPSPAGTGEGIGVASGQAGASAPAGSVSTSSRPDQPRSEPPAEPSADQPSPATESGLGWKTIQDAERDYKGLQKLAGRYQQVLKSMGDPQTVAQERALLAQLREHPGFISWVQQELAKEQAGSGDPDTVRALQIVEERARQVAQEMVAPLYAADVERKVQTVFSEMDKEFGPEWGAMKPQMNAILAQWKAQGLVSEAVEQNFDYNFVKGLYAAAAAHDPAGAARAYQKRLEQARTNMTVSQPGTAQAATTSPQARSMREAYAQAKRDLGVA